MPPKLLIFVSLLCVFCHHIAAFIFDRCSLTLELVGREVPYCDVPSWVCIVQIVSNFNTAGTGPVNPDGSRDWGLFRINDRYWCDPQDGRQSANTCHVACRELIKDDIGEALLCAQTILRMQGFSAWPVWNSHCGGGSNLPNVDDCFNNIDLLNSYILQQLPAFRTLPDLDACLNLNSSMFDAQPPQ